MKRLLYCLVTLLLLILLVPVIAFVAVGVLIDVGPPIFFRQVRPGLKGRPFTIYKFRTMRSAADHDRGVENDHMRMTRFGSWLRDTSLDEIPELWNVLRGEMSFVGPRPLLIQYLPLYTPEQMRRHDVRPGLTGWAQVNGRNALSWEEKFRLDVWYVDNRSFALDFRILMMTAAAVIRREGISYENSATMPEFRGTPEEHSGD